MNWLRRLPASPLRLSGHEIELDLTRVAVYGGLEAAPIRLFACLKHPGSQNAFAAVDLPVIRRERKDMHQLGVLLALVSASVGQTTVPAVGKYVVLKQPGVAVIKDYRPEPPEVLDRPTDVSFCVVDVQGDWLWVNTPRGMGWVNRSDALLPEDAVPFFSAQIEANPKDAEAWGRRGVARSLLADMAFLRDLNEAIRLNPRDPRWLHERARCCATAATGGPAEHPGRQTLLDRALADASEAARLDPTNASHVVVQGSIWRVLGNTDKESTCADAALRLDPACADAYCLRAMVREDAHDPNGALADYGKAIELNPGHGDAYNNRALLLSELHAYDRVIDDATACLRLGARPAQAYRLRGLAWDGKRDADKALADLDASLRLEPGDKHALMYRAEAKQMKGDLPGAIEDIEKAAASAPDDLTILPVLAGLQMQCRNWTKALATLQTWVARAPNDPRPHGGLADLYATCPDNTIQDGKKAVECAKRACELTQWKNPFPIDTLATACAMAGDLAGAVHWEKVALEDASFVARNGAEARHRLKQYEAAVAAITFMSLASEGELDESKITWENYEKIKCGMSLSEVVAILGPPGRGSGRFYDCVWLPKKAPTMIRVMFDENGKVGSKAQIGLGDRN